MNVKYVITLFLGAVFCSFFFSLVGNAENIFIRENFTSLDRWKPLEFRSIKSHSTYSIEQEGEKSFLKTESHNSASGLVLKETFNVQDFPVISWRWKTENIYKNAKGKQEDGDDYPLRLYVLFQHEEEEGFSFKDLALQLIKTFYGDSLPDSALSYVWSSEEREHEFYSAPGVENAYIFPINSGNKGVGSWQEHSTNIIEDYRRAFGKEPPSTACLAIMNDSDSTGESSVSFIDYVEISPL